MSVSYLDIGVQAQCSEEKERTDKERCISYAYPYSPFFCQSLLMDSSVLKTQTNKNKLILFYKIF